MFVLRTSYYSMLYAIYYCKWFIEVQEEKLNIIDYVKIYA